MSDISTVKPPYVRGLIPDEDDPEGTLSLEPNHIYMVGLGRQKDLTLFSNLAKDNKPSFKEASQLDQNQYATGLEADGDLFTLVTHEEKPLKVGSHFFTDADNTVRFPNCSGKPKITPYLERTYTDADGNTHVEDPDVLKPNQLIKVDYHPKSHFGLCKTVTPSGSEPSTIERAWQLDLSKDQTEKRLEGLSFAVVTATERREMAVPFTLAIKNNGDVDYEERVPRTNPDNVSGTSRASIDGNKASPASHGTLLAATASKKGGSDTPAISMPSSEAPSLLEQLKKARFDGPSKRRP